MSSSRISDADTGILKELYAATKRTVDDLPYTSDFESLYAEFCRRSSLAMDRHGVWRALASCRKGSGLVRKVR